MKIARKYYKWDEQELSVGIKIMDNFHKNYVDILNRLIEVVYEKSCKENIAFIFHRLVFYTENYFVDEEILLKEHNYPGFSEHKSGHNVFIENIIDFHERYMVQNIDVCLEMLKFLEKWYREHIVLHDNEAIDFLLEKGVE